MVQIDKCNRCGGQILGPYDQDSESGIWIGVGGKFSFDKLGLITYLCIECGYVEQFVSETDIRDIREYLRLKGLRT